uniref:Ulp1 protease family, C-terminal catalytic domain containing protein n=1 Tax=Solanum tuberosum TaxID=4113 RepID=M1A3T8_SOLTU
MPYALNVWVYECASVVDDEIAVKKGDYIPRIRNWRVVGVKPKFEMFMSNIFTENSCTNIQPTYEELTVLDLPDNMGVSHSEHSTSTDKPTQAISEDIPAFECFSSKPPDQIDQRGKEDVSEPPFTRDALVEGSVSKEVIAKTGYVSENHDPTRPKSQFTAPAKEDLINVE